MNGIINRLGTLIRRCVISRSIADDGSGAHNATVAVDGSEQIVQIWQQYGTAFVPSPKDPCVKIGTGGNQILLTSSYPQRKEAFKDLAQKDLKQTEVCMYHPPTGSKLLFRESGDVLLIAQGHDISAVCRAMNLLTTALFKIEAIGGILAHGSNVVVQGDSDIQLAAPLTTVTGDLIVTGNLTVNGASLKHQGVEDGKTHTHTPGGLVNTGQVTP